MTLRLSRLAEDDIDTLYRQGADRFGVRQADKYVDALRSALRTVAANPRMVRLRHDFSPPVRIYRFQSHMVFYREEGAGILILRILHGRQDWMQHFTA